MAANFFTSLFASSVGSLFAGASKQYVKQDEVNKEEARRIAAEVRDQETWDKRFDKQQGAIDARTSNEERKAKEEQAEQMLGQLAAVGYTPGESKEIIAGKTFALYYGIGEEALKMGVTGSSLLQTHDGNVDAVQATLAGSALPAPVLPATATKFRFDPIAVAALYNPLDETSISISTRINNNTSAQVRAMETPKSTNYETDMAKLIKEETFLLDQLRKKSETGRAEDTGGGISVTDINTIENIYSKNYMRAALRSGFSVDPETSFVEAFKGKEGRGFSSQLAALHIMDKAGYQTDFGDLGADKFNAELQATVKGLERHAIDEYLVTQKVAVDDEGVPLTDVEPPKQLEKFLTFSDFINAVSNKTLKVGVPVIIPNVYENGQYMLSIFTGVPNDNIFPTYTDESPLSLPVRTFEYAPLNYGN